MKHFFAFFLLCAVFSFAAAQTETLGGAENAQGAETLGGARGAAEQSDHYRVICDTDDAQGAKNIAREMEARYAVYNRLFRFDSGGGENETFSRLTVRVFSGEMSYNDYVAARLGSAPEGAVYLHYNQAEKRELVIHAGSEAEARALSYHAFVQYLRAFVSNPPAWIREGFAVYFEGIGFNGGVLSYEENLSWLDTVRNAPNPPAVQDLLLAEARGIPENFAGFAWSLVSFFLNYGGEEYTRAMTDSFLTLSVSKTAGENAALVEGRMSRWLDMERLTRDYRQYLDSRQTFARLMEEGQRAYAAGDTAGAEMAFLSASIQKPSRYAPYYFLGLLSYEAADFETAEKYYISSMKRGADAALVSYALGVNAARAGKKAEAENYLRSAAELSPERYREKAGALLERLNMSATD